MALEDRVLGRFKRAGGSDFSVFVPIADASKAFQRAVEDARHESGHGGYSGTIAEKHGFEIRRRDPMSREEAAQFANKDAEHNEKWGDAYAIPVGETTKAKEKKAKVKVGAKDEWSARSEAEKLLREQFKEPGLNVALKIDKVTLVKEGKLPEMAITKGGEEGFRVVGPGTQGKPFTTRAEAVTAFKAHVLKFKPQSGAVYRIEKYKTSDTFTIGDVTKSLHMFEVEATMSFEKPTGKILGWIFYGIASS